VWLRNAQSADHLGPGVMDLVHRAGAKGAPFLQEAVTKMELDFQSCPTTSGTCGITIRPLGGCS